MQDGQTALHYAASHAKEEMMKLLLHRRADPNVAEKVCAVREGRA